jgi:hypothetical protein
MNIKFSKSVVDYFGQDKIDSVLESVKKEFGDIDCYIPINIDLGNCLFINGKPVFNNAGYTSLNHGFTGLFIRVQLNKIFMYDSVIAYQTLLHEIFHAVEMSSLIIQVWYDQDKEQISVKDSLSDTITIINKRYYTSATYHDSLPFEKRAIEFAKNNSAHHSFISKVIGNFKIIKAIIKYTSNVSTEFRLDQEVAFTSDSEIQILTSRTPFKL